MPMTTAMIAQENHFPGMSSLTYPIARQNAYTYVDMVHTSRQKKSYLAMLSREVCQACPSKRYLDPIFHFLLPSAQLQG